jgi:hypothetical protein
MFTFGGVSGYSILRKNEGKLMTNKMPVKIGDIYVAKTIGGITWIRVGEL